MLEQPADPAARGAVLVETAPAFLSLAQRVATASVVAVDVEANSLYAYRERACVLQVNADGSGAIVDLLAVHDLAPLARALDRDDVEVVLHGGDYDIALLSREHAVTFRRVFDTMIAAMLLGEPRIGLADLVQDAYSITLDKRFQTADWGRRPLTSEQLAYLDRDTAYLPGLAQRLRARLEAADLVEEAAIEFRRLAARRGHPPTFDPEGWRAQKGASLLDPRGRATLARLWTWRDGEAARQDRPPFKVLQPRLLVDLARVDAPVPTHPGALGLLPASLRARYGGPVLEALRGGEEDARTGRAPPRDVRVRLTPEERRRRDEERRREEGLKAWRRAEAAARKVPNLVVLPNRAMAWIAREDPAQLRVETIAAHPDVGPKRAARYGEAILAVARGGRPT